MSNPTDRHCYDDILDYPYRPSTTRAHMSMHDRAAQFAPFAALNGFDEALARTAQAKSGEAESPTAGRETASARHIDDWEWD